MGDNSTSDDEHTEGAGEIKDNLEALKVKNKELRESLNYLKIENLSYKQRYQSLKQNLTNLSHLLEKNVQIYNELFDDTRSALEIARVSILASPNVRKERNARNPAVDATQDKAEGFTQIATISRNEHIEGGNPNQVKEIVCRKRKSFNSEETQDSNPKVRPSTSNVEIRCTQRKKIPIEPINMQELVDKIREAENDSNNQNDLSCQNRLTTIAEEENLSASLSKTVSVKLTRLSTTVLNKHLKKENFSASSDTSINELELSARSDPNFTSTPMEKIAVMRTLGLMPSPKHHNQVRHFISVRKKPNRAQLELLSPKKERLSLISPKTENSGSSKENFSPKSNYSNRDSRKRSPSTTPKIKKKRKPDVEKSEQAPTRPSRKARPRNMKEKSMRTKMRRS